MDSPPDMTLEATEGDALSKSSLKAGKQKKIYNKDIVI